MQENQNEEVPLLSALMIVHKPDLIKLHNAIECFKNQTYPYKELIIVNNANNQGEASEINIQAEKDVFLVDTPYKLTAGHAKNYAISAANGQILAQFDYDCWHAPDRLETQVYSLAQNNAQINILSSAMAFSYNSGRAYSYTNNKKLVLQSMVYIRQSKIDYPATDKNEEFGILSKMLDAGLIAISIDKPELMCKWHFSDNPVNKIVETDLPKKTVSLLKKVIKNAQISTNRPAKSVTKSST